MNIPIPMTERFLNGELVPTYSARELHAALGVKTDFPTWIRKRIHKNQFTEGTDYILTKSLRTPTSDNKWARPARMFNYHCSAAMIEQLITIEQNDPYVLAAKRRQKPPTPIERAQQAVQQEQEAMVQIEKDKYIKLLEDQIALLNKLLNDSNHAAR